MNTKHNRRARETEQRVETAFLQLLEGHDISAVRVSDLCRAAGLSRTSFYAHYSDIYELRSRIADEAGKEITACFARLDASDPAQCRAVFTEMFCRIRDDRQRFGCYLSSPGGSREAVLALFSARLEEKAAVVFPRRELPARLYRVAFFVGGFYSMLQQWLQRGCSETPEEMAAALEAPFLLVLRGR